MAPILKVAWKIQEPLPSWSCKRQEKDVAASVSDASCILGTGSIDYKTIVPLAKKAGMEYFIVEQELWENSTLYLVRKQTPNI